MKFDPKEISEAKILGEGTPRARILYKSPITARENWARNLRGEALWVPHHRESMWFTPRIIPDNIARAMVVEGVPYKGEVGGKDMFGVTWEYEPRSRGSIVRPGNAHVKDVTQWREIIKFPDVDSWDWETSAEENREFLKGGDSYVNMCMFTGWFERLISTLDCGPALIAMRRNAKDIAELLDAFTDTYIDIVDHAAKYYGKGIDGFCFHDDWGSQDNPFFNVRMVEKLLVPPMKRATDHVHALGYTTELHSCGKIDQLVPCMIEAGWDAWAGMAINDYATLYEQYGDKICMRVTTCDIADPNSEECCDEAARKFFEERCADRSKPVVVSLYANAPLTFQKALYKVSREAWDAE